MADARRRRRVWVGVAFFAFLVLVAFVANPPSVRAEEPSLCAAADLDTTGFQQPELETRRLRNDVRELCAAVVALAEDAAEDTENVRQRVGDAVDAIDGTTAAVQAVEDRLAGSLDVKTDLGRDSEGPLHVSDATAATVAEESYQGLRASLWFLIGVAAAGLAAFAIYRQVMPRG